MRPFSYSRTNTSTTARLSPSSMVKRSRVQSQLAPSFFCCSTMRRPYSSRHCQARFRKPSRPKSCLVSPSLRRASMIFTSVAMEAWSVPGSHRVGSPFMR